MVSFILYAIIMNIHTGAEISRAPVPNKLAYEHFADCQKQAFGFGKPVGDNITIYACVPRKN